MMTSSNGNIFRVTGHLCGEFTDPGELSTQRPVTRSFDVFFDLRLNKWLSKQWWGWWFEMLSHPLWRHCNARPKPKPKPKHRPRPRPRPTPNYNTGACRPFHFITSRLVQWDPSIYFGFLSVLWPPAWRANIGPAYLMALGLVEIKLKYPPLLAILTASGMNTFRQRQHGCHFAEDIFKFIFLNVNLSFLMQISLKFPMDLIDNSSDNSSDWH